MRIGLSKLGSRFTRLITGVIVLVLPLQGMATAVGRVWMPEHKHQLVALEQTTLTRTHNTLPELLAASAPHHHHHDHHCTHPAEGFANVGNVADDPDHQAKHRAALAHHHPHLQPGLVLLDQDDQDLSGSAVAKSLLDVFDLTSSAVPGSRVFPSAAPIRLGAIHYRSAYGGLLERPPRSRAV